MFRQVVQYKEVVAFAIFCALGGSLGSSLADAQMAVCPGPTELFSRTIFFAVALIVVMIVTRGRGVQL
jgi:hypothetical protein